MVNGRENILPVFFISSWLNNALLSKKLQGPVLKAHAGK